MLLSGDDTKCRNIWQYKLYKEKSCDLYFYDINCEGVCFLLGNSPASEFYVPTFRNALSVLSS